MANAGSYGTTSTTSPSSSGSFPTTPTGEGLGVNGVQVANLSVAQFLSDYDISSTEQNTYLTDNNGTLSLNQNALMLMQYKAMDESQRLEIQQDLVNAGMLAAPDADGADNTTAESAFKSAITTAATSGSDVNSYLLQYQGTNNVEGTLSKAVSEAQNEAETPTTAELTPKVSISQAIEQAFNQDVGVQPTQQQINDFISQVQGQETSAAAAPHQAAEAQLAQLKSDQSAISQMGPDGITAIIQAYTNAIHGVNPAAGSATSPQGPQVGTETTNLPAGTIGPMGAAAPGYSTTTTAPNTYGRMGSFEHNMNPINWSGASAIGGGRNVGANTPSGGSHTVTTQHPTVNTQPNLSVNPTAPGTTPSYGGIYTLNPNDWTEAQKLTPAAAKYKTPGAAPAAIQQSAFTNLLQNLYDNNGGNWTDAIVSVAGGTSANASKTNVAGSSTNLQTFATGIAAKVNDELTQLNTSIANNNVITKTEAPTSTDIDAEAAQAAKEADPTGYYAANAATWGSFMTKALYGTPLAEMQPTTTFTGPVGSAATGAESGTSIASTPAPAPAASGAVA